MLVSGCVKKQIYFPLPVTFHETISISNYSNGIFGDVAIFNATELKNDIQERINDFENSSINDVLLESVTYTLLETNNPNTVINSSLKVVYGDDGPYQLLEVTNLDFNEILQKTQNVDLEESAVELIVKALRDIVFDNQTDDLIFGISGTVDPVHENLSFKVKVDLTVNTIVTQCQEIFDPLGSDNEICN
jgi:hypothetical protein